MPNSVPGWVLREPVAVTPVMANPEEELTVVLISRNTCPGAITLTFDEDRLSVNGLYLYLGEDYMPYCSLIDDVFPTGITQAEIGVTRESDWPYPTE